MLITILKYFSRPSKVHASEHFEGRDSSFMCVFVTGCDDETFRGFIVSQTGLIEIEDSVFSERL